MRRSVVPALLVPALAGLLACSAITAPLPTPSEDSIGHVHALALNPGDGLPYAATHQGVFRLEAGKARPVADRQEDTTGFAITGPDTFLGSGHPAPGGTGPRNVGLIGSTDGGRRWTQVSLSGVADLHSLAASGSSVYGWDSLDNRLLRSDDAGLTWQRGATIRLTDLAVDPEDPLHVLAAGTDLLMESRDGGHSFSPVTPQPPRPLTFVEFVTPLSGDREPRLAGLDASGTTWALNNTGWDATGTVGASPQAFTVMGPDRYVAATEAGVLASEDGGRTWSLQATGGT